MLEKSDQLLAIVSQKLKETNKYFGTETLAENMCLLCKSQKVSIIFMNCGHAIVCQFCVKHIKQICILCKNRIKYSIFATPQEISEKVDWKIMALSADKTISVKDSEVSEQEVRELVAKVDLFHNNDYLGRPQESGLNSPAFNVSNRDMNTMDDYHAPRHKSKNIRADSIFSDDSNPPDYQSSPRFMGPSKFVNSKTLDQSGPRKQTQLNSANHTGLQIAPQTGFTDTEATLRKKTETAFYPTKSDKSAKLEIAGRRDLRVKTDTQVTVSNGFIGFDNISGENSENDLPNKNGYLMGVKSRSDDFSSDSGIEEGRMESEGQERLASVMEESGSTNKVTVVSRKDVWSGESISIHSQKEKKGGSKSSGGWN